MSRVSRTMDRSCSLRRRRRSRVIGKAMAAGLGRARYPASMRMILAEQPRPSCNIECSCLPSHFRTPAPASWNSSLCATCCAGTPRRRWGRGGSLHLAPSTDRAWIENQQQLTTEIREFRRVGGRFDFSGLLDITKLVEKSRIAGAALEPPKSATSFRWLIAPPSGARLR